MAAMAKSDTGRRVGISRQERGCVQCVFQLRMWKMSSTLFAACPGHKGIGKQVSLFQQLLLHHLDHLSQIHLQLVDSLASGVV